MVGHLPYIGMLVWLFSWIHAKLCIWRHLNNKIHVPTFEFNMKYHKTYYLVFFSIYIEHSNIDFFDKHTINLLIFATTLFCDLKEINRSIFHKIQYILWNGYWVVATIFAARCIYICNFYLKVLAICSLLLVYCF